MAGMVVDGDPLDILVLSSFATFPGCVVPARVLGALHMRDDKGEDLKILAAVAVDPRFAELQGLEQVPGHVRREVEHFFRVYKELEGQAAAVGAWLGAAEAAGPPEVTVQVANFQFQPSQITLKKGQPARIVLVGQSGSHTFTAPDLQVDVAVGTGDRKTVDVTPTETGTFAFRCRFHEAMVGTIVVTD